MTRLVRRVRVLALTVMVVVAEVLRLTVPVRLGPLLRPVATATAAIAVPLLLLMLLRVRLRRGG